jgi:hypothetical protein
MIASSGREAFAPAILRSIATGLRRSKTQKLPRFGHFGMSRAMPPAENVTEAKEKFTAGATAEQLLRLLKIGAEEISEHSLPPRTI